MLKTRFSNAATRLAAFLAALAVAASPASARRPRPDDEINTPVALGAMHDFGRCLAHDYYGRRRVQTILAMDYHSDAYRDAFRNFLGEHGHCVAPWHSLRSNGLIFAGAIAEALLPRDLPAAIAYDPARPAFQARDEIEMMSLCTVRAAPADAAALFATRPASPEESAALRVIAPELGQCLRAGSHARVNMLEVRALLALAAWRLSELNAGASAANAPGGGRPPAH